MKKILLAIAFVIMVSFCANAQSDGFFRSGNSDGYSDRTETPTPLIPGTPTGETPDTNAPLGSGLLILTAMGAGYVIARKK